MLAYDFERMGFPDFVTVLECEPGRRLAKLFTDPNAAPSEYDGGWLYRAEEYPIETLADLADILEALAGDPTRCVIRGRLRPGAQSEWVPRRSGDGHDTEPDFEAAPHHWLAIDLDASVIAFDPKDPRASIEAWRATLPMGLRDAGMVFKLSAKAHLFPYLRGHAWVLARVQVDDKTLRAWYPCVTDDPSLAQAVQVHYTADPVFASGGDPLAGKRLHVFEGGLADIDWGVVPAPAERVRISRTPPEAPPEDDVLAVLGPAIEHEGHRWHLCGALGGVWRRMGWTAARARATIEAWLEPVPGCDIAKGVKRCLGAWEIPFDQGTGKAELALHLGGDEAWAERIAVASNPRAKARATGPDLAPMAAALVGDVEQPPLLSAPKRQMYIRDGSGYFGPVALELMRGTLRAVGLLDVLGCGSDGKPMKDESLYKCGAPVHEIVRSFEETGTRYDGDLFTLYRGYQLPEIEPVYSEAVAGWLSAMAGDMLPNVLDWIALCSQANIARRAAALVIVGEHSTGKSLIFKCLAQMWGAVSYVPLKDAAAQFNASICECPIVCDDECQALKARLISSEEFRERVQARSRKYEPKGHEKVHLMGYTRECIAANSVDEVTIARVFSASTREAVEARLCVVRVPDTAACRAALLAIAGGDQDAEAATIRGHLAWLWSNHEVTSTERFAGAGGDGVHAVALAGIADEGAEIWDYLHGFLTSDAVTGPVDSARPFVLRDGQLLVYPQALAAILGVKGGRWDAKAVGRILGALRVGERVMIKAGGKVVRYWPLDMDRALCLAGVSSAELLDSLDP